MSSDPTSDCSYDHSRCHYSGLNGHREINNHKIHASQMALYYQFRQVVVRDNRATELELRIYELLA